MLRNGLGKAEAPVVMNLNSQSRDLARDHGRNLEIGGRFI
jgi:hypothetical protein